jgi:hypothetical protein
MRKVPILTHLLTASVGINAEGGEFLEIVKKMVFQGKSWSDETRTHLIKELGDTMFLVFGTSYVLLLMFLLKK